MAMTPAEAAGPPTGRFARLSRSARALLPRSLLGQMLWSVALALLVAQTLSAVLIYRADQQRRETGLTNALAFQLVADPRTGSRPPGDRREGRWRLQRAAASPLRPGEERDAAREDALREILAGQGIEVAELVVARRDLDDDAVAVQRMRNAPRWRERLGPEAGLLVAGLRRADDDGWLVSRLPVPEGGRRRALGSLFVQTLVLYLVLVGGLALLLRRITRPLADLRRRVENFGETPALASPMVPTGPADMRRLIEAHNAMEARIATLIDEKDVMLGAIGHDLKTPLAALRVRIETVDDETERTKMAATIEDITRTLDDILSLARVGRPTDPLESTDLAALTAAVVEEFEDMREPVELGETQRIALPLRATWMRRALRNLIGNALRYGGEASVCVLRADGHAVVRIEDNGPGIPEDEIATMLEPFTRGEASRNRETGGAGLGLTLARAIAEQHGGTLVLANARDGSGKVTGLVAELRLPLG